MKMKIAFGLGLVVVALFAGACRQKDVRIHVIHVPEMNNEACRQKVEEALRPLPGILAQPTFSNRAVIVKYESLAIAHKNMEIAIAEAGFTANDVAAKKEAQAKLPKECLLGPPGQ